jgi:hypothetical protein
MAGKEKTIPGWYITGVRVPAACRTAGERQAAANLTFRAYLSAG